MNGFQVRSQVRVIGIKEKPSRIWVELPMRFKSCKSSLRLCCCIQWSKWLPNCSHNCVCSSAIQWNWTNCDFHSPSIMLVLGLRIKQIRILNMSFDPMLPFLLIRLFNCRHLRFSLWSQHTREGRKSLPWCKSSWNFYPIPAMKLRKMLPYEHFENWDL